MAKHPDTDCILTDAKVFGRRLHIDLWYPRNEGHVNEVYIGLMDVRASDGIRVRYDFDRDGWVILQERVTEENPDGDEWIEVAFIQSWALDELPEAE